METLIKDIRYGIRSLVKRPGLTAIIVITLALGIGATTAIFSVVNAVLLRPLPFPQSERLVAVVNLNLKEGEKFSYITWPDFADWRAQNQSFEKLAGFNTRDLTLTGAGEAARLHGAMATSDLFPMLGVSPQLGRTFTPDEDKPGAHTVILSHSLWQRRFGADPNVAGRAVTINGQSYVVIGVMPQNFGFPFEADPVDLWINAAIDGEGQAPLTAQRGNHYLEVIGRLKPGVGLGQAQAEMGRIAASLAQAYPDTNTDLGATGVPFFQRLVGDVRFVLLLLFGAIGCVLLIACANVANLLLARATSRQREIAIRTALGASRWRTIRQLLTESVLLSLCGGTAGLLVAIWGTDLLLAFVPPGLPRVTETAVDARVLGFTFLVSVLLGVLFGLAPAWQGSKSELTTALKEGGRGPGEGARGSRIRSSLIVAQVAIAFCLLVCAGLLINSFWHLRQVNPGFVPNNLLTFKVSLPETKYEKPDQIESFYQQLVARIKTLPGVQDVSAVTPLPLSGDNFVVGFAIEGVPNNSAVRFPNETFLRVVRNGYFRTMGIPLVQGRDFEARDNFSATQVAIINESLARKYFPNQNPIGRRINPSFAIDERGVLLREVIGVVKDVHHASLSTESGPEAYVSQIQTAWSSISLVVRTNNDPEGLTAAIRREVGAIDKELPLYNLKTMEQRISSSYVQPRFQTLLLGVFAAVALVLTAVGLYGVLAYSVTRRTHEIGIRMALGAQSIDVLKMVIRNGMTLVAIGVTLGLAGAFASTRLLSSLLFAVSPTDVMTFAIVSIALIAVALVAIYIPAHRATRVDPLVALRYE